MKHPYKILGLSSAATQAEIKKAYHRLAQKYHPDTGTQANAKHFAEIAEAYRLLKEEQNDSPKELVQENSFGQNEFPAHLYQKRIDPKRKKEQEAFYRSQFRQAVLKVIGLSFFFALMVYFFIKLILFSFFFDLMTLFLGKMSGLFPWMGAFLALLFGMLFGFKRFFELQSFLTSRQMVCYRWGYRLIVFLLGMSIFIPILGSFLVIID